MDTQLKEHTGGCFCSQIRYRVLGEALWSGNCHCTNCRRFSGAPFSSEAFFEKSDFEWLQGELTQFPSSDAGKRGFCARCGSQLVYEDERLPNYIGVNIGSLDEPESFPPQFHIWTSSKLPWIQLNDGLSEYPQNPPMDGDG